MLSAELAELRALITPASVGDSDHREARRRLRRSYRSVSAALDSALALGGWPGGRPPSEHEITEALADVLDHACHQDVTTAAAMQRVVLARCPAPVRHYYRNRPLQVRRPRSGSLPAPDLVLDGRMYQPAAPLPNVFLVEVKDQAKWEVPYAAALYGQPADGEYDLAALWGLGHDDPSGLRVPHTWRSDCEGFWHHQVGRNAYVASAVQLDVYVAYASRVLRDLGMADFPDEPRVQGVLVDMWARTLLAEAAVTWQRWATTSFADLLAGAFSASTAGNPTAVAADRLKALMATLLWLLCIARTRHRPRGLQATLGRCTPMCLWPAVAAVTTHLTPRTAR